MPDFWSHQIAAKRAYALYTKFESPKLLFKPNFMDDYFFGAQGPDFFYYINQKKPFSKKHYSTLGTYFHHNDVYKTLEMLIEHSLKSDHPPTKAYVAGYLTHYIIDSECHPHICTFAPDSRAHKVYELTLDALCVMHYEQLSIHDISLTPNPAHETHYLETLWQPILKTLSIESTITRKCYEGACGDMFAIQEILLSDLIGKRPWLQRFSKLFNYDLSQLIYPKHFTEDDLKTFEFDAFNAHFVRGVERSLTMLQKLEALYHKNLSKDVFLEWLVKSDYLGEPIKNGGQYNDI